MDSNAVSACILDLRVVRSKCDRYRSSTRNIVCLVWSGANDQTTPIVLYVTHWLFVFSDKFASPNVTCAHTGSQTQYVSIKCHKFYANEAMPHSQLVDEERDGVCTLRTIASVLWVESYHVFLHNTCDARSSICHLSFIVYAQRFYTKMDTYMSLSLSNSTMNFVVKHRLESKLLYCLDRICG